MSKILRSIMTYGCYPFWGPIGVARRFGRVPYISVPAQTFLDKKFDAPVPSTPRRPYGIPADAKLDAYAKLTHTQHYTVRVPGGSADHQGFVFDQIGRPIHGACQPVPQQLKYRWRLQRDGVGSPYMQAMKTPTRFSGSLAVVTAGNQGQYYHWLFDALPKLAQLQRLYPNIDHYYVPQALPFQKESLSILNLGMEKVVNTAEELWVSSDELIVPCHQIMTGYRHPQWVCSWLRDTFLPTKSNTFQSASRIYLSRSKARNRHLLNEEEIYTFLSTQGFEYYVLEELSLAEQIRLFERADVVVATHGSGLANLVFCQPQTTVIELFPSRTVDIFYRLSSDLNLQYAFVQTRASKAHRRIGEDFSICVDDLKEVFMHLNLHS